MQNKEWYRFKCRLAVDEVFNHYSVVFSIKHQLHRILLQFGKYCLSSKYHRGWIREKKKTHKRRQDGELSGCLVSTQKSVLSTGGCEGFIAPCPPTAREWQVPAASIQSITDHPTLLLPICPPESNKGCPPSYVGAKKEERGKGVKERSIPSDSLWSMDSNYSELIFSAWLIPKWIKCGPHYCWLGAHLKRLKEDQGCGL